MVSRGEGPSGSRWMVRERRGGGGGGGGMDDKASQDGWREEWKERKVWMQGRSDGGRGEWKER